jgi:phosphoribosylformylglycinamidine synthase
LRQWRFEISSKSGYLDVHGESVKSDIEQIGIESVEYVQSAKVYLIEGDFDRSFADRVGDELLADTVCEEYYIGRSTAPAGPMQATVIEVHLKSGVTDPVAESVTAAIADMGEQVESVRTARKYILLGGLKEEDCKLIAKRILANDCIEEVVYGNDSEPPEPHTKAYEMKLKEVSIRGLGDAALESVSKDMDLFLDLREMQTIQKQYEELGREPTDIELETLAQTWSEHCVHKTLKSSVDFEHNGEVEHFDNLLKETVFGATDELNKDWCVSVFSDNAGVVEFDDETAVCFKVETHNHPSALDPYGGAATGIGGVIRDPMGTGMGAKPVANTDIFCFARPDTDWSEIPKGVLHPARIMKGVVSGVRDYGNRMGIPTVNGAVYFDQRYMANPLVFCGNVGLIPRDKCFKHPHSGDVIMVVGGRTGRDGIHGATFSSGQMTHEHETIFSHAVQIGNAITEKKTLDTLLQARDAGLYEAITDCGAGGLSSAVGEMGEKLGAEVQLDKVPLKYSGLSYTEIWISEAQERMVIAVKPENLERISELFASEDVEATVIGRFTDDKKLSLRYEGQVVGELDMEFLHDGLPKYSRQAKWDDKKVSLPVLGGKVDFNRELLGVLSCYNVASKEWIIRQYDHEVQGGSVVKPLVGVCNDGPSDAAVVRPKYGSNKGVAISCGMNPMYGDIDPYAMALAGIDEAFRNIVCVGGRPDRVSLLDNFCWGDCRKAETFGSLVLACKGCYDGAMGFGAPFISGKDSLNNEFVCDDGREISIPSTLLISAMSIVDDVNKCVTMDLKDAGNFIFVVGLTRDELGGSHYLQVAGGEGGKVPVVDVRVAVRTAEAIYGAIQDGLVASCHDCSEGGLATAVAEMAFAGGLGAEVNLGGLVCEKGCESAEAKLFGESCSRYVVEVRPGDYDGFVRAMAELPFGEVGVVSESGKLRICDEDGGELVNVDVERLKKAWQEPLNLG